MEAKSDKKVRYNIQSVFLQSDKRRGKVTYLENNVGDEEDNQGNCPSRAFIQPQFLFHAGNTRIRNLFESVVWLHQLPGCVAVAYIDTINERDGIQGPQNWEKPPVNFADQMLLMGSKLVETVGTSMLEVHLLGSIVGLLGLRHVGIHVGLSGKDSQ